MAESQQWTMPAIIQRSRKRQRSIAKKVRWSWARSIPTSRQINNQIHTFERTLPESAIVNEAGGFTTGSLSIILSNVRGYAELTALYDLYRICKAVIIITPLANSSDVTNLSTPLRQEPFYWVRDYNDDSKPASINELFEYSDMHTEVLPGKQIRILLYPKCLRMLYESAIATSYEAVPSSRVWISTSDPNVPHYGLKWAFADTQHAVNTQLARMLITVTIQCKNQR